LKVFSVVSGVTARRVQAVGSVAQHGQVFALPKSQMRQVAAHRRTFHRAIAPHCVRQFHPSISRSRHRVKGQSIGASNPDQVEAVDQRAERALERNFFGQPEELPVCCRSAAGLLPVRLVGVSGIRDERVIPRFSAPGVVR
jgi:hypothetical protein